MKKKNNKSGYIVTIELILIGSVLVVGMIAGMVTLRDSVNKELEDLSRACSSMNQSYSISGLKSNGSATAPSFFHDKMDKNDDNEITYIRPDELRISN